MLSKRFSHKITGLLPWCCSLSLLLLLQSSSRLAFAPQPVAAKRASRLAAYGKLPLSFELNAGQADRQTGFLARGKGYSLSLSATEAVLTLSGKQMRPAISAPSPPVRSNLPSSSPAHMLRIKLLNANPEARSSALEPLPGKVNYMFGNDAEKWRTNIPTYARVRYDEIYPGVAMVYYGKERKLEYDFIVAPGTDPSRIALGFEGADKIDLDGQGDLLIHTPDGIVKQHRPIIYQEVDGVRKEVQGSYLPTGTQVRFRVAGYDARRPLVIDPILSLGYSTYLGGSGDDIATDIALDGSGNAYITGLTTSGNFPARQSVQPNYGGGEIDAFVAKLNPAGTNLIYATYLGGNDQDQALGIAVDASGSAYVTGQTCSRNFPTQDPIQPMMAGLCDGFVTKLNAAGSALDYSTYLGGSQLDPSMGIAVDTAGNAYVAGWTQSANFPTRNAMQPALAGIGDAFLTKFSPNGSELVFSTFLGGSNLDFARAVAVDAAGNAYLTGETRSTNFPTVNPLQPVKGAGASVGDAFVTKFNPTGTALVYSTFLGGSCDNEAWGIAVDAAGSAYVTGNTCSTNFPTVNAFQSQFGGGEFSRDAFVSKLNPAGSALVYSTYLGGSGSENDENMGAIAVDAAGQAYVGGQTNSANFPVKSALQSQRRGNSDFFITKFTAAGSAVVYSTYLGGSDEDGLYLGGMAVDGMGNAFVAGFTRSKDFPTTTGAFQPSPANNLSGSLDAVVARIVAVSSASTTTVSAASFASAPVAPESIVAAFGTDLAVATQTATAIPLPAELAGTTVKIRDSAGSEMFAPLFFVSNAQVNYLIPSGTATGAATVSIAAADSFVSIGTLQIAPVAPGLFAANANGQGVAAAIALRVKADSSQVYEPVVQFDTAQQRLVSLPIDLGPAGEQVYLILFGTGIRYRGNLTAVTATLGGTNTPIPYAGPQGEFVGLDQVNAGPIPRSLIGRGEVGLLLTVDGKTANVVLTNFR